MEIYKIPACWPTTFFNGIPLTDLTPKQMTLDDKTKILKTSATKIDITLLDFIFQFCKIPNLSRETAQAAVIIFNYYISTEKNLEKYDLQLVAMTCILICSKMYDVKPISLNLLHTLSAHVYNNAMVLNCESYLLKLLDYDIFIRDSLICDRVGVFLENIRSFFEDEEFNNFSNLCLEITDLLFADLNFFKVFDFNLLCASVIQAGIVIATKREGKLPITIKISVISGTNVDDIMKVSKKIIKHCLGREVYKQFNF